jgi:signal transduction histidine kinase
LTLLLVGLLGAWLASGWADVRARQVAIRGAPTASVEQRTADLARELRGQLEALIARVSERKYFEFQNLFHDPKGTATWSVAPSPLAGEPENPLVLGYFQLDAKGRATTPTLNDELPELSEPKHLVEHRAFRDAVARDLARELAPSAAPRIARGGGGGGAQVYQLDAQSYTENAINNAVYQNPVPQASPRGETGPVTIIVSGLEWRTVAFQGAPALVAVRRVTTPDGDLAQGFVVDRSTVTSWLASHAGEHVAELHTDGMGIELVPGWQLHLTPNPRTVAQAAADAAAVARGFVVRFVLVGALGAIACALVLLLVVRAEKLARERSQFAAAAAHELRTPLAGLQLYGDMLAEGLGDPAKLEDYAKRMSEEAARLGRVVSNVLGFSQLERGNLSVDAHTGSLGEALRTLADRAQPALDRAGAALDLEVAIELRARFDRDALARIVANLLDNAEKYARGATDRTIRLAATDLGDVVEVSVSDRGPGVSHLTPLFRPFSRGDRADAPAGLGLGLALSQSLARAMGGDLVYRPGPGGGATFALRLPRA